MDIFAAPSGYSHGYVSSCTSQGLFQSSRSLQATKKLVVSGVFERFLSTAKPYMVSIKRLSNFCGFQLQSQAGGQSVMSYLHFGHAQHVSSADLSAWSTRALCPTSLKGPTSAVEKMDSHCGKRKFKTYEDSDVFERYSELCARNVRARSPANLPQAANVNIFEPMYDVVVSSMSVHSNDQRKRIQSDSQRGLSAHEVESSKRIRRHTTAFRSASVDHIGTSFGHTQDSCLREIK